MLCLGVCLTFRLNLVAEHKTSIKLKTKTKIKIEHETEHRTVVLALVIFFRCVINAS